MIAVLLSSYNGTKYIYDQIQSVLLQTIDKFSLYIRDDGSTDNTVAIIKSFNDSRITLIEGENVGINASFFSLMKRAKSDGMEYIFFCDQDDIWNTDKIETLLSCFSMDTSTPELIFSDFSTIDDEGLLLNQSFATSAKLRIPKNGDFFPKLLAQPYAFGCCSAFNRALLEIIELPSDGIEMYDCWISLSASILGRVQFVSKQTISHRFHHHNATGRINQSSITNRLHRLFSGFAEQANNTAIRLSQIDLLLRSYGNILMPEQVTRLNRIRLGLKDSPITALITLYRYGVSRGGVLQNAFYIITVLACRGGL